VGVGVSVGCSSECSLVFRWCVRRCVCRRVGRRTRRTTGVLVGVSVGVSSARPGVLVGVSVGVLVGTTGCWSACRSPYSSARSACWSACRSPYSSARSACSSACRSVYSSARSACSSACRSVSTYQSRCPHPRPSRLRGKPTQMEEGRDRGGASPMAMKINAARAGRVPWTCSSLLCSLEARAATRRQRISSRDPARRLVQSAWSPLWCAAGAPCQMRAVTVKPFGLSALADVRFPPAPSWDARASSRRNYMGTIMAQRPGVCVSGATFVVSDATSASRDVSRGIS